MQQSPWLFVISGVILSPIVVAICALFAGLWQRPPEPRQIVEEELGT